MCGQPPLDRSLSPSGPSARSLIIAALALPLPLPKLPLPEALPAAEALPALALALAPEALAALAWESAILRRMLPKTVDA